MAVTNVKYSIKIDDGNLDAESGENVLREFIYKVYKRNPIFKVKDIVEVVFYEYYQKGHISVDLTWRFKFSKLLFTILGGKVEHDEGRA